MISLPSKKLSFIYCVLIAFVISDYTMLIIINIHKKKFDLFGKRKCGGAKALFKDVTELLGSFNEMT